MQVVRAFGGCLRAERVEQEPQLGWLEAVAACRDARVRRLLESHRTTAAALQRCDTLLDALFPLSASGGAAVRPTLGAMARAAFPLLDRLATLADSLDAFDTGAPDAHSWHSWFAEAAAEGGARHGAERVQQHLLHVQQVLWQCTLQLEDNLRQELALEAEADVREKRLVTALKAWRNVESESESEEEDLHESAAAHDKTTSA